METHAHHLHKAPGTKFRHYFFEFLMLFIAVFCGFLAENFRERQVEKERGEQYIMSFYEDLKADTARLTNLLNIATKKIEVFQNLNSCYESLSKNIKASSCMEELLKYSRFNNGFQSTDRTLRQLSNAGGFRLLSNEDADSIIRYESANNRYQNFQSTVFQGAQDNVRYTLNMLADFTVNSQLMTIELNPDSTFSGSNRSIIFIDDKVLLNKYFNELLLYKRVTITQKRTLTEIKVKAENLIEFFKKKHHFE